MSSSCIICYLCAGEVSNCDGEVVECSSSKRRRSVRLSSLIRQHEISDSSSCDNHAEIVGSNSQVARLSELVATELGTSTVEPFVRREYYIVLWFVFSLVCLSVFSLSFPLFLLFFVEQKGDDFCF